MTITNHKQKIVLIRLDRIGDLVCTLPVDQILHSDQYDFMWVINKGLGFIIDYSEPNRKYLELDLKKKWQSFWTLFRFFKINQFDHAILFHTPWWVSLCAFIAGVNKRSGPASKWHTIFLNNWIRQKRSQSTKHEADYNFELLVKALGTNTSAPTPILKLTNNDTKPLSKLKVKPKEYFVFHPGMSGSALNWPMSKYESLILQTIDLYKLPILISGTNADDFYLKQISHLKSNPSIIWAQGLLTPVELISVLQNARAVLAPSTGVAHLAASTGTPTIGLYSPVPVQSKIRWGQRGNMVSHVFPQVMCPIHFKCIKEKCKHFNCMNKIEVDQVAKILDTYEQKYRKTISNNNNQF